MNFSRISQFSKMFTFIFLCGLLSLTSCKEDESTPSACESIGIDGGALQLNGESATLSVAQVLVSTGFDDDVNYQFQIAGAEGSCTELQTVSFVLAIPSTSTLDGTYSFKPFFDANDDDAYGNIFIQNLESLSQSSSEIMSGTVTIVTNGEANYTLDINATPVLGSEVTMKITHQF